MSGSLQILRTNHWLGLRLIIGVIILIVLAIWDWRRRGRQATRWREYTFMLAAVGAAMIYGIINDQITSRISWEYFYYGKELENVLGPQTPPDPSRLHWQAAKIGMMATWSAGLIAGACLLVANNPSKRRLPQLGYKRLISLIVPIILITALCGVIGGVLGYFEWLTWISEDFDLLMQTDALRPRRFMCTYGVHLGGYVGGLSGLTYAVWRVRRLRRVAVRWGEQGDCW